MAAEAPDPPPQHHIPRLLRRRARLGRPRHHFAAFVVSAVLVLAAVATATVLLSGQIARSTAVDEAQRSAVRLADNLVGPHVRRALADTGAGREAVWAELQGDLAVRVSEGSVVAVLVYRADGEVLWSTIEALAGRRPGLTGDLRTALAGDVVAHVDDDPETHYGSRSGPLLEVYVPVDVGYGPMAVEAYFPTDSIDRQAALLRGEIVPLAVGALVVLQLIQLPIAASMARRASRSEADRVALLSRSITASDRERRAIAGDVHDGPVQDLAGVSYALAALRPAVSEERRATVDRLTSTVRHAVASLRRLMVDIYPPDLSGPGLALALDDLALRLRESGTEVTVTADPLPELPSEYVAVLYRTAKEALANVSRHAAAGQAWVTLTRSQDDGSDAVLLTVADDGVGVGDGPGAGQGEEGHLGLRLVRERLIDLGGDARLEPRAGGGTVLTAVLPVPHVE